MEGRDERGEKRRTEEREECYAICGLPQEYAKDLSRLL
jgi:hypothetical protein